MMGVWNARLLDDSLHKALYGRGKALYQSTHHYKDFGLLGRYVNHCRRMGMVDDNALNLRYLEAL